MVYRLGDCELDDARFELRREGRTVAVEPQVLELLLYLVAHRDRAVTRTELFDKLWRGRIVTDSALNSRIKAARSAIGDDGASQAQIRTLHRTGYRFVGLVEELPAADMAGTPPPAATQIAVATASASVPRAAATLAHRRLGLAGAALGLLLAAGAFSLLPRAARDMGAPPAVASSAATPASPAPASNRNTLTVLPFTNLSADPQQKYFADGIGVELMKVLSHLPDLQVTASTSSAYFRDRNDTPRAIGEMLGVEHLLTGSVRKAEERVRIAVELVDAASGYQVWSERYDRELGDIFEVQDEIAERVASALQVKLGLGENGELGMTRDVAAYDEFLRGYAAYTEQRTEAFPLAVEHMRRAIALDPSFSRAWAYLYCIYLDGANLVPERAEEWTRKSLEALKHAHSLTPNSPFVRILNAREEMRSGRRLEARATLDAMPAGYWTADRFVTRDVFLGRFLIATGQAQDALETLDRARAADPLSPVVALYLSLAHAAGGHAKQALAASDRGIELGSLKPVIAGHAMLVALGTRDPDEIKRRAAATASDGTGRRAITDELLPYLDDPAAARAELRRLAATPSPPDYIRSVLIAHWAAYFGDAELALEQLRNIAHGAVDEGLLWRPVLSEVRQLPGFKDLVRREGLVDYWRAKGWPDVCRPTVGDDFECA
jgi:TolB-like protein/DNA-binding winged helix-turn-helix (wHTH) protein